MFSQTAHTCPMPSIPRQDSETAPLGLVVSLMQRIDKGKVGNLVALGMVLPPFLFLNFYL